MVIICPNPYEKLLKINLSYLYVPLFSLFTYIYQHLALPLFGLIYP